MDAMTPEEGALRRQVLRDHPRWTVELDSTRRWVIRDQVGELLARHLDIVTAQQVAEERKRARL